MVRLIEAAGKSLGSRKTVRARSGVIWLVEVETQMGWVAYVDNRERSECAQTTEATTMKEGRGGKKGRVMDALGS